MATGLQRRRQAARGTPSHCVAMQRTTSVLHVALHAPSVTRAPLKSSSARSTDGPSLVMQPHGPVRIGGASPRQRRRQCLVPSAPPADDLGHSQAAVRCQFRRPPRRTLRARHSPPYGALGADSSRNQRRNMLPARASRPGRSAATRSIVGRNICSVDSYVSPVALESRNGPRTVKFACPKLQRSQHGLRGETESCRRRNATPGLDPG